MTSQVDLDQGGTNRQFQKLWLGPSVGWVNFATDNPQVITAAGSYTLLNGITRVMLNVAGLVTLNLWDPTVSTVPPANCLPGPSVGWPLTIVDIGGNLMNFNCTINPAAGTTIMGLSSLTLSTDYGSIILKPDIDTGDWAQLQ